MTVLLNTVDLFERRFETKPELIAFSLRLFEENEEADDPAPLSPPSNYEEAIHYIENFCSNYKIEVKE